jgi:hypothetical protein
MSRSSCTPDKLFGEKTKNTENHHLRVAGSMGKNLWHVIEHSRKVPTIRVDESRSFSERRYTMHRLISSACEVLDVTTERRKLEMMSFVAEYG